MGRIRHVPHPQGLVVAPAGQRVAVRTERHCVDDVGVAIQWGGQDRRSLGDQCCAEIVGGSHVVGRQVELSCKGYIAVVQSVGLGDNLVEDGVVTLSNSIQV